MGWAWADHEARAGGKPGHAHEGDCDAGGATNGTNQIGELCAVLEALRAHPGSEPLVIETDSQYAINCSTKWVHGWKRNGWKNSQKKPVKNAALIRAIDEEIAHRAGSVKFVWVKGHAGNAGNEKVDELARTYAGDCRSGAQDGYLPLEGWQSLQSSEYARGLTVPPDAQSLIDGEITTEEYHLGRGRQSDDAIEHAHSAGSSHSVYTNGRSGTASSVTDTTISRAGKPSLADLLVEPEGVPELGTFGAHNADSANGKESANDEESANEANSTDDASGANSTGNTKTAAVSRTITDGESAINASGDDAARSDETDTGEISVTANNANSEIIINGDAAGSSEVSNNPQSDATSSTPTASASTAPALRPTALRASGTLRFTPPPSSSPTFDGRPRLIRGMLDVQGYVNGDGTITIADAQFYLA